MSTPSSYAGPEVQARAYGGIAVHDDLPGAVAAPLVPAPEALAPSAALGLSARSAIEAGVSTTVGQAGALCGPAWLAGLSPERDLDRSELGLLVRAIAADRLSWLHLVRHDPERRHFVQLHRDPHLDVWLLCWTGQQETGLHDHDLSMGAVHVCQGALDEDRLVQRGRALRRATVRRAEGETFDFDASHVHCVRHSDGSVPAVSIHAYSPALCRMGYYDVGENGALRRRPVSYAEEMLDDPTLARRTASAAGRSGLPGSLARRPPAPQQTPPAAAAGARAAGRSLP